MQKEEIVPDEQLAFPMTVKRNGTNNHTHTLPLNAIELKPDLITHPRIKSDSDADDARKAARTNIGTFFTHLYMGLFPKSGYEISPQMHINLLTGEKRDLHPDLIQRGLFGDKLIEIKGTASHNSKAPCAVGQIENYFYLHLKSINDQEQRPVVRYNVFRYGDTHDYLRLHSANYLNAGRTLARNTKDSLVLATNQALLLFMLSRTEKRHGEAKGDAEDRIIPGSAITLLHDTRSKDLKYFFDGYEETSRKYLEIQQKKGKVLKDTADRRIADFKSVKRFAKQGFMHLDDLTCEQFPSDRNGPLVYRDVTLPVFPVTVYSIKNYLWKKRKKLLS